MCSRSPDHQQLHVAGVAVGELNGLVARVDRRLLLVGGQHEVGELAAVRVDEAGALRRHRRAARAGRRGTARLVRWVAAGAAGEPCRWGTRNARPTQIAGTLGAVVTWEPPNRRWRSARPRCTVLLHALDRPSADQAPPAAHQLGAARRCCTAPCIGAPCSAALLAMRDTELSLHAATRAATGRCTAAPACAAWVRFSWAAAIVSAFFNQKQRMTGLQLERMGAACKERVTQPKEQVMRSMGRLVVGATGAPWRLIQLSLCKSDGEVAFKQPAFHS